MQAFFQVTSVSGHSLAPQAGASGRVRHVNGSGVEVNSANDSLWRTTDFLLIPRRWFEIIDCRSKAHCDVYQLCVIEEAADEAMI